MSIQPPVNKRKLFFNFLTSFSLLLFEMRVIAGMQLVELGDMDWQFRTTSLPFQSYQTTVKELLPYS